jgi:hypothetical protein
MLKLMPFIGPLMGIFKAMLKFIIAFLICFAIEIIFFSLMAQLILQDIDQFKDFQDSVAFLMPAAIGNYDFENVFQQNFSTSSSVAVAESRKTAAKAFLMTFVIINTIFVMSFFIAMITTLYRKKGKNHTQYYFNQSTLTIRPITYAHKNNSVMVSVPVPLNVFHIFYTSCLLSF